MKGKLFNYINEIKKEPIKRSMLLSALCKPLGMIISFIYTPLLLDYLGEESYGIWSTILSVVNWITYFDVGIGQGLRNSLTRYIVRRDEKNAKESVSTGYVIITMISLATFLLGSVFIVIVDLGFIFNTDIDIKSTFMVSFLCICLNFVLSLSKILLFATQQAEKVSFMTVLIQFINLIGIAMLSLFSNGSLFGVACVIGLSGVLVNIYYSKNIVNSYPYLMPSFWSFNRAKLKEICGTGLKFFVIQLAALILYSTDNLIITRLIGPEGVTPYNTSYTAFGIVNGVFAAMISPLWSKYTAAVESKDYKWIKKTIIKLDKLLPLIAAILLCGVFVFEPISQIWLRKKLNYDSGLVTCMALYYFIIMWGSIYATAMNGMGRVNMQLILGVVAAIINIPLSFFLGGSCGLGNTGVCLATVLCMLVVEIPITIDVHVFLNDMIRSPR